MNDLYAAQQTLYKRIANYFENFRKESENQMTRGKGQACFEKSSNLYDQVDSQSNTQHQTFINKSRLFLNKII